MKVKSLLLLASLLMTMTLNSQSFILNEYEGDYRVSSSTMEADDGSIFVAVVNYDTGVQIMKMTDDGAVIKSKCIAFSDRNGHRGFHPFFAHPERENTNVYVYVTHKDNQIPTYNAVFFDNNLNIIEEISKPLYSSRDLLYRNAESYLLDSENNIIVRVGDGSNNEFLFVKMDIDGNILSEKKVYVETKRPIERIPYYSLCEYSQNPLQYGFIFVTDPEGELTDPYVGLAVLDSEFNLLEVKDQYIDSDGNDLRDNIVALDDSYLVSSSTFYMENNVFVCQGVKLGKYDKEHNLINSYKYAQRMENYYPYRPYLGYKNIVTTEDGGIYWIYTEDIGTRHILHVSYFDSDLNLQWDKNICQIKNGNGAAIFSATLRKNGELLISMIDYDILRTIVLINDGQTLNIEENNSVIRPYSFYPNPASDMINLSFSPDVKAEKVEIYGIDGKLYHEQNFNLETINIDNLSNGVYMMKVQLTNGNTYTDKIVVR